MLKEKVQLAIAEALGSAEFTLLYPRDKSFGDFAVNAHQFKKLNLTNDELLEKLKGVEIFESAELVSSFINIRIKQSVLIDGLNATLENGLPKLKNDSPKRISLEFGQPNTHKLPHIGHLFSYTYGESMARLLAYTGHTIFRSNYQGDVGLHVAKCLYVYTQKPDEEKKNLKTLEEKAAYLQICYQEGSALYDADPEAKSGIDQLNKAIYNRDAVISEVWEETRGWCVEYYKKFEERLGTTYDRYYYESETSQPGIDLVKKHTGDIFEESEGATVFKGEKYGLHTRVFLTKNDTPTYEAKDIGLIKLKSEEWPFDQAIVTTASEQNAYWQVVKKAIELVFPELEGKIMHFGFGMIDLKGSKMASRTGNIISAIELVDTLKKTVSDELLKEDKNEKAAEVIAVGAVKYAFLKSEARKNMLFDIEQSVSVQGNSGPYLQYAYARIRSVLTKAAYKPQQITIMDSELTAEDMNILRLLPKFEDTIQEAAEAYSPHIICTYVFELAQACNLLYDKQNILKAPEKEKEMRFALLEASGLTIKTCLYLLGIEVLERI